MSRALLMADADRRGIRRPHSLCQSAAKDQIAGIDASWLEWTGGNDAAHVDMDGVKATGLPSRGKGRPGSWRMNHSRSPGLP